MINFTDAQRRDVALFLLDVWKAERQNLRRKPTADELIVAAHSAAIAVVGAEVGNPWRYLGAPGRPRSALADIASGVTRVSAQLGDRASLVLDYLRAAGDRPNAKPASIDADRRVMEELARHHFAGGVSDSAIGRKIGLSHTQVRDRKLARAARIMARLHSDCPWIWTAKGRPISDQFADITALPLAA
jgi:hypothetical protein